MNFSIQTQLHSCWQWQVNNCCLSTYHHLINCIHNIVHLVSRYETIVVHIIKPKRPYKFDATTQFKMFVREFGRKRRRTSRRDRQNLAFGTYNKKKHKKHSFESQTGFSSFVARFLSSKIQKAGNKETKNTYNHNFSFENSVIIKTLKKFSCFLIFPKWKCFFAFGIFFCKKY